VIKTVRIACKKICLLRVRARRRFARGLGEALFAWALNSEVPNWVASHSSEQRQDVVACPMYPPCTNSPERAQTVRRSKIKCERIHALVWAKDISTHEFFRTLFPPLFLKLQRYFITTGHHLFAGHRSSSSLNEEYDAFVLNRLSLNRLSLSPSCLPRLHTRAHATVRTCPRALKEKKILKSL
jgi:hypothetical protein